MHKTCTKCGETKSVSDFYKDAWQRSGTRSHCKACIELSRVSKKPTKKCHCCGDSFISGRSAQITCGKDSCTKQLAKEYRNTPKHRTDLKNRMAEWRTLNPAKKILSNLNQRENIDLDLEWIQERLDKGVCEATGIPFESPKYGEKARGFNHWPWNASVDKIDPQKGYSKENCRMVVWAFNRAKGLWSDEDMLRLAKGIVNEMAD